MATTVRGAESAEDLRQKLTGQWFGSTRVVDVATEIRPDADGEDAIFLSLTLNDPESETWPLTDMRQLRHAVQKWAPRDLAVYVTLRPETEEPVEPEDDELFA